MLLPCLSREKPPGLALSMYEGVLIARKWKFHRRLDEAPNVEQELNITPMKVSRSSLIERRGDGPRHASSPYCDRGKCPSPVDKRYQSITESFVIIEWYRRSLDTLPGAVSPGGVGSFLSLSAQCI